MIPHSKPTLSAAELAGLKQVLASGQLGPGAITKEFEHKLAAFIGQKYGIATNSGTAALHLALLALGITRGDEVIIPSYVCGAVLNAALYTGARPVLADVELASGNLDLGQTKKKLTKKTKAIILPHMFGLPSEKTPDFVQLGIPVIEDCPMTVGANLNNKKAGSFGLLSVFSFYATKYLTTGQGGLVLTSSAKLAAKICDLKIYDKQNTFELRYNYALANLSAALGLAQLRRLPAFIKKRRALAKLYQQGLARLDLVLPPASPDHIYYRYLVRAKRPQDRAQIIKAFRRRQIEIVRPVYQPLHQYLKLPATDFPNTERIYNYSVSLPIYPRLTKPEALTVIKAVRAALT